AARPPGLGERWGDGPGRKQVRPPHHTRRRARAGPRSVRPLRAVRTHPARLEAPRVRLPEEVPPAAELRRAPPRARLHAAPRADVRRLRAAGLGLELARAQDVR